MATLLRGDARSVGHCALDFTSQDPTNTSISGIAEGSQRDLLDIIAINVRTEIAFGLFTDGCTSLSWKTQKRSLLGQNWDWMEEQKENLIAIEIHQPGFPIIKMMTEAGMIGKIGLNSAGVGVCFNAIRAKGLDASRMPVHLGLRAVLDSTSAGLAIEKLEYVGMASSAHMLIADASGSVGLEFTSTTFARLEMDNHGRITHSNHMLLQHEGLREPSWLPDSPFRIGRIKTLTGEMEAEPSWTEFSHVFEDEKNFPAAICRKQQGDTTSATLFNIVMDLMERRAVVRLGRPCAVEGTMIFHFEAEGT
ncbi:MAG: hypothetical protein Q9191_007160 [Dirinaria sp. TL-2023a]